MTIGACPPRRCLSVPRAGACPQVRWLVPVPGWCQASIRDYRCLSPPVGACLSPAPVPVLRSAGWCLSPVGAPAPVPVPRSAGWCLSPIGAISACLSPAPVPVPGSAGWCLSPRLSLSPAPLSPDRCLSPGRCPRVGAWHRLAVGGACPRWGLAPLVPVPRWCLSPVGVCHAIGAWHRVMVAGTGIFAVCSRPRTAHRFGGCATSTTIPTGCPRFPLLT